MMYVSISAPGSPQVRRAQDANDYAGKIVRLRDDGTIPPDNPFVGRAGYQPGIYTMGHRNGHGLAANPETGEMWETEQGPSGGEKSTSCVPVATTAGRSSVSDGTIGVRIFRDTRFAAVWRIRQWCGCLQSA